KAFSLLCGLLLLFAALYAETTAGQEVWGPDFLIIGAQKSGTTALVKFLNKHLFVKIPKEEIHFFDLHYDKGVDWYQQQFSQKQSSLEVIGEKSPYYLFHPTAPKYVQELYPKMKLIVILRNPVDRAYSQYWHNLRYHEYEENELETFEDAI